MMLFKHEFYRDPLRQDLTDADVLNALDGGRIEAKTMRWVWKLSNRTSMSFQLIPLVARGIAIDSLIANRIALMRYNMYATGELSLADFWKPDCWRWGKGIRRKERREQTRRLIKYRYGWW